MKTSHVNNGPPGDSSDLEPGEIRMIGDFDGSANALWSLYGQEAQSHDKARIQTLKEDMDGVLILSVHVLSMLPNAAILIHDNTGWSVFRRSNRLHTRQQTELESQPHRPNGVLPSTECRNARSDFPPNLLHCSSVFHLFHPAASIPCF